MTPSLAKLFATFFYSGMLPKCPGTWGTLATLPLILIIQNPFVYIALLIFLFIFGRLASDIVSKEMNLEDPKVVVIDEVVGMMVTMLFVPVTGITLIIGFALFRFFDIVKPLYIKRVESYPNGYGIMFDDLLAGIYANILLQIIIKLIS